MESVLIQHQVALLLVGSHHSCRVVVCEWMDIRISIFFIYTFYRFYTRKILRVSHLRGLGKVRERPCFIYLLYIL